MALNHIVDQNSLHKLDVVVHSIKFYDNDSTNPNTITLQGPTGLNLNYNLIWPLSAGSDGQLLGRSGTDNLDWFDNEGATGFQGPTGFQGSTGFQGETGMQGSTGFQGFSGFQGETGFDGFDGATGPQGSTGPSITPSGIGARISNSTNLSLPNNTQTTQTYDGIGYDTNTFFNGTDTLTVPTGLDGYYSIFASAIFDNNIVGDRQLYINDGGIGFPLAGVIQNAVTTSSQSVLTVSTVLNLTAGSQISVSLLQNSGGSLDSIGNPNLGPVLTLQRISPL